jgi:hypothetical protein
MSRAGHARAIDAPTGQGHSRAPRRTRRFRPSDHAEADATTKLKRRSALSSASKRQWLNEVFSEALKDL